MACSLIVLLADVFFLLMLNGVTFAQDNYEIQVYPSETVPSSATMLELHSNFTFSGSTAPVDGVLPSQSSLHETVEITHGFTSYFETGLYFFTSARSGNGWQLVGTHLRPRVRAPDEWHWPLGVSLSAEFGYQQRAYAADTWTLELRPIVDGRWGGLYISLNPSGDIALDGSSQSSGLEFAPNLKVAYSISGAVDAGFEYYSSLGPVSGFDPPQHQKHQIFPTIDLNLSPEWECNFGMGIGMTSATDRLIAKLILGRRFGRPGNH